MTMSVATRMIEAVKAGDADGLRTILTSDAEAATAREEGGDSPLLIALYHGRRDLAELMLSHGRRVDAFEAVGGRGVGGAGDSRRGPGDAPGERVDRRVCRGGVARVHPQDDANDEEEEQRDGGERAGHAPEILPLTAIGG
jgi:ankyrin repeat protein